MLTPEIKGRMDARAALRRLLAGTPLQIASDSGQVITLRSSRSSGTKQRAETGVVTGQVLDPATGEKSEEHTSELQSLMRISYAVFCLKKKNNKTQSINTNTHQS